MGTPLRLFIQTIFPEFTINWAQVEPHLETRSLKKGDLLLREGDPCEFLGLTLQGCLRLFFLKDGKELTLFFCPEGYPLGDYQNLRLQRPAIFSCQAIEDAEVLVLNRQVLTVLEAAPEGPQLMRLVVEFLAFRLRDRLLSLYCDSPEQRYLALMESEPDLVLRVPQHYIASYLGLEPESLSRLKRRVYQRQLSRQKP
ncbi:Crp/Fnr family transcriptional regulator [Nodosilinea nodulosa]|uniref:Crp/Fnr family transcriptional regulator n=1 Tax=Nodosilinea nodulosa TaxID=416001 RepID=UPI0003180FED|nr:Crp/Fnr family transcriptional regulator [Nodosilinea nodulosa]